MAKIVPKLNLNKTPQLVDNNSLVMAKNIRLLQDGTIGPDTSLEEIDNGSIIDSVTTQTVVVTPEVTHTEYKRLANIWIPQYFDARNPRQDYLTVDNITYKNYEILDNSVLRYSVNLYSNNSVSLVSDVDFKFDDRFLVNVSDNNLCFVYFILLDCYRGILDFDTAQNNGVTPYYYGMFRPEGINRIILINGKQYIIVNPYFVKLESYTVVDTPAVTAQEEIINYKPIKYISQIVGLNDKIYFFKEAKPEEFQEAGLTYPSTDNEKIRIFEYDENNKQFRIIKCGWRYSGGKIDGEVTINNTNEEILTICEYFDNKLETKEIPIKHINLSYCDENDDESIYTQAPNVPISNLSLVGYYTCNIPNGVYQFFIRYKIREDFYTTWFPCSSELFAGKAIVTDTIQGQLRHIDNHKDCPQSFKLHVEHLFPQYFKNFIDYQIGFILSHDDSVVARSWKSFDFTKDVIYFDYDKNFIEEIDIDELLKTNYELFNVKNITYYKNKLYIANYKETNFNPDLQAIADQISVTLVKQDLQDDVSIYFDNKKISLDRTKANNKPVNTLLDNPEYNKITIAQTSSTTQNIDIIDAEAFWKDADNVNDGYKRDIYWLRKQTCNIKVGTDGSDSSTWLTLVKVFGENDSNDFPSSIESTESVWNFAWLSYGLSVKDKDNPLADWNKDKFEHKWYWNGGCENDRNWGNGWSEFVMYDYGIHHRADADNQWSTSFLEIIKEKYPKHIISGVRIGSTYYKGNSSNGIVTQSNEVVAIAGEINNNEFVTDDDLIAIVKNAIKPHITSISIDSTNGTIKYQINGSNIGTIYVDYIDITYESNIDHSNDSTGSYSTDIKVVAKCQKITKSINIELDYGYIRSSLSDMLQHSDVSSRTLMPFTDYEFYIHYIKQNGITTNGYLIDKNNHTHRYNGYVKTTGLCIIYPQFTGIKVPDGYVGYYISINKVNNDVARCFNHRIKYGYHYVDCLECDTLLYNLSDNIHIYQSDGANYNSGFSEVTKVAKYHSSGSTDPIEMFGNCGIIRWPVSEEENVDRYYSPLSKTIRINKSQTSGLLTFVMQKVNSDGTTTDVYETIKLSDYATQIGNENYSALTSAINTKLASIKETLGDCFEYSVQEIYEPISEVFIRTFDPTVESVGYVSKAGGVLIPNDHVLTAEEISASETLSEEYSANPEHFIVKASSGGAKGIEDEIEGYNEILTLEQFVGWSITIRSVVQQSGGSNYNDISILNETCFADESIEDNLLIFWLAILFLSLTGFAVLYNNDYWIVIENNGEKNKNKRLTKITPFVKGNSSPSNYTVYDDMNLPGFIVGVQKLDHNSADQLYVTGSDIYTIDRENNDLALTEKSSEVVNQTSDIYFIPSNFNLNCVTLNDDIVAKIRTYYTNPDDDTTRKKQIIKSVQSLTSSTIFTLPTMYYDYIRKYGIPREDKRIVNFDNTIRSSDVNTDERYRNIYRFEAEDMYNFPVNRGRITNMFNLTNYIYVHTEHSMFKFSGNNNISSTEGEISLKEGDIFENGVSELFDAKHGYAGLQHKHQSLVMFDSYVFWDNYIKKIYAFGGEAQLAPISDSISKIIKALNPIDVKFVADEPNDRFFVNLYGTSGNICLSFSFKAKSFIAVHDIDFLCGFNTRKHTYLVHINTQNGTEIGWSIYHTIDYLKTYDNTYYIAYQNCWTPSAIAISDVRTLPEEFVQYGIAEAVIDIINNENYEVIKSLEYINWICSEILEYGNNNSYVAEETLNRKYAGTKLRIYSDECGSNLVDLVDSNGNAIESNNVSIANPNSWQNPRYNCGIWSINYFRDIRNKNDIFNYKANKNKIMGLSGHSETTNLNEYQQRQNLTQENSLIYGKYIVFRLIFDNRNFKLENVTFKTKNYDKVQ